MADETAPPVVTDKLPLADPTVIADALQRINNMRHVHMWIVKGVNYTKPEFNTIVLVRCSGCGLPATVHLDGCWTRADITKGQRENQSE